MISGPSDPGRRLGDVPISPVPQDGEQSSQFPTSVQQPGHTATPPEMARTQRARVLSSRARTARRESPIPWQERLKQFPGLIPHAALVSATQEDARLDAFFSSRFHTISVRPNNAVNVFDPHTGTLTLDPSAPSAVEALRGYLDQVDAGNRLLFSDLSSTPIRGSEKNLYRLNWDKNIAVLTLRYRGRRYVDDKEMGRALLEQEVADLAFLRQHGVPTIRNYGVVQVDNFSETNYGIKMDYIANAESSNRFFRIQDRDGNVAVPITSLTPHNMHSVVTVRELEALARTLQEQDIHVGDLELLIVKGGHIYVIDPVRAGVGVEEFDIARINHLIDLARTKGRTD